MNRSFRRLISACMLVVLLVITACSGGNAGPSESANGASPSESTNIEASSTPEVSKEKVPIKIMANFPTADITPADQAVFDKVEEAVNVDLEFIVPPSSGYLEQLQLSIASGDYPDVVFFPSESTEAYLSAVDSGLLIPINPFLENAPNLKKYTYDISWEALQTKRDGNIYGIPRTSIARYDGYSVRKDWLDKIGFEIPANHEVTIDQFTDILRKFTFDDPDGNGNDDTYGFSSFLNTAKMIDPVLSAPFGNLGWRETTGGEYKYMTPMYDQKSTVYKDILAYTQMLYKEGLLDPDAAVIDTTAANDRFKRGITGMRSEFAGYIAGIQTEMKNTNPDAEISYLFVQDRQGGLKGAAYGTAMFGLWGITNTAKNPEKIVEMFDWMLSDEGWQHLRFGVEGASFNTVDGKREYIKDVQTPWKGGVVRRAGDGDFFINPAFTQEEVDKVKPLIDKAVAAVEFSLDRGFVPAASREPKYLDYKITWDETIMKIIVGELPVDAYDKLLTDWYAHGGKEYVEQMNEYIASVEKK